MSTEAERACLVRLQEMDTALERMERELPDDVRALGAEARQKVSIWLHRLGAGGADLSRLTDAMREISTLMDVLAERLLLTPWDARRGLKN